MAHYEYPNKFLRVHTDCDDAQIKETVLLAHQISEKLNSAGIPAWLTLGSQLGAIRDGGIVKDDKDIDMGICWKDWGKFKDIFLNSPSFALPFYFDFVRCFSGGEFCWVESLTNWEKEFRIEIWGYEEYDGIKSSAINMGKSFRSKLYYNKNLKEIFFEKRLFYVSKYAEKHLDFLYKDVGGEGNTWRTRITQDQFLEASNTRPVDEPVDEPVDTLRHLHGCPAWNEEDKVTGYGVGNFREDLLKEMNQIFDKVIIAPKGDSIITVNWMEENNIDYIVCWETDEDYLREYYYEPMHEERLLLMKR